MIWYDTGLDDMEYFHWTLLNITTLHSLCCSILLFTCCDAVQGGQQTICGGYVPHALHVQGALCDDDTLRPVRAAHPQVCQQRPLPPSGRLQHKARYDTTPPSFFISSLLISFPFTLPPSFFSFHTLQWLALPYCVMLISFIYPIWFYLLICFRLCNHRVLYVQNADRGTGRSRCKNKRTQALMHRTVLTLHSALQCHPHSWTELCMCAWVCPSNLNPALHLMWPAIFCISFPHCSHLDYSSSLQRPLSPLLPLLLLLLLSLTLILLS